nr:hypothetical protein [Nitratireductor aquimarinus]
MRATTGGELKAFLFKHVQVAISIRAAQSERMGNGTGCRERDDTEILLGKLGLFPSERHDDLAAFEGRKRHRNAVNQLEPPGLAHHFRCLTGFLDIIQDIAPQNGISAFADMFYDRVMKNVSARDISVDPFLGPAAQNEVPNLVSGCGSSGRQRPRTHRMQPETLRKSDQDVANRRRCLRLLDSVNKNPRFPEITHTCLSLPHIPRDSPPECGQFAFVLNNKAYW